MQRIQSIERKMSTKCGCEKETLLLSGKQITSDLWPAAKGIGSQYRQLGVKLVYSGGVLRPNATRYVNIHGGKSPEFRHAHRHKQRNRAKIIST